MKEEQSSLCPLQIWCLFHPPIRSLGISFICGRFLWIHSWHTPGCGLSNQGSQGSGQDPPAQQPNGCHFHISFCSWELNCQSKSSLSCFFAAATTSHPKSLQDSNQHSDQTRPNQKLVSICFYHVPSVSILLPVARASTTPAPCLVVIEGPRSAVPPQRVAKLKESSSNPPGPEWPQRGDQDGPWDGPRDGPWDGGQHLEAWGRLEVWGGSD